MVRKNYAVVPLVVWLVAVGLVFVPVFIFGMGATVKAIMFMFSKPAAGSIPIWAIFVAGLLVLMYLKRRQTHRYMV